MCFVFDLPVTLSGEERGFPIEGFLSLFVSIIYNDIGGKSIAFVQFQRFLQKDLRRASRSHKGGPIRRRPPAERTGKGPPSARTVPAAYPDSPRYAQSAEQPQGLRQSHEAGEAVCHQYPQRAELRPAQQVSIVDGLQQIPEGEVHGDAFQLFRVLGSEARQFRRLLPLLQQRKPVRFQNFQIL